MQPTSLLYHLHARTEIQVVCITKNDLSTYLVFQFLLMYGLDSTGSTDRHEDRCLHISVRKMQYACACGGGRIGMEEVKTHGKKREVRACYLAATSCLTLMSAWMKIRYKNFKRGLLKCLMTGAKR